MRVSLQTEWNLLKKGQKSIMALIFEGGGTNHASKILIGRKVSASSSCPALVPLGLVFDSVPVVS
jgi:hypothetical protein